MPGADALKLPEGAAASIVADFHHGHGTIDLSSLGQPAADHHQRHEPHGQGGEHHLDGRVDADAGGDRLDA